MSVKPVHVFASHISEYLDSIIEILFEEMDNPIYRLTPKELRKIFDTGRLLHPKDLIAVNEILLDKGLFLFYEDVDVFYLLKVSQFKKFVLNISNSELSEIIDKKKRLSVKNKPTDKFELRTVES